MPYSGIFVPDDDADNDTEEYVDDDDDEKYEDDRDDDDDDDGGDLPEWFDESFPDDWADLMDDYNDWDYEEFEIGIDYGEDT